MHTLARHFTDLEASAGEYRQWGTALIDYHATSTQEPKPPLMRALLSRLRKSPVGVLRKGQKLATFDGQPSVRQVEEWLGALRMGEVTWVNVED